MLGPTFRQNWRPQEYKDVHGTLHDALHDSDAEDIAVVEDDRQARLVPSHDVHVPVAVVLVPEGGDDEVADPEGEYGGREGGPRAQTQRLGQEVGHDAGGDGDEAVGKGRRGEGVLDPIRIQLLRVAVLAHVPRLEHAEQQARGNPTCREIYPHLLPTITASQSVYS